MNPCRSQALRIVLPMLALLANACSQPSSFSAVSAGTLDLAETDLQAVESLLRENSISPDNLRVLGPDDSEPNAPPFVRISSGRITQLVLDQLTASPRVLGLEAIKELRLSGSFAAAEIRQLPALETLEIHGNGSSWTTIGLSDLPSLTTLRLSRGQIGELDLQGLDALRSVTLDNLDLEEVPTLPVTASTVELPNNRIHDLSPLQRLSALERLDLSGNGLESLRLLPPLARLRFLRLADNPLPSVIDLQSAHYPALRSLNLQRTDVTQAPLGLADLTQLKVRLDEAIESEQAFLATLQRLRQGTREAPGELVERLGASGGTLENRRGNCRWTTGMHTQAKVSCSITFERLKGLAGARLGTTDLVMPFQGGGAPRVDATLRVDQGKAALYLPLKFDNIEIAARIVGFDLDQAEKFRQPEDHFEGYRKLLASPGAPAIGTCSPSLVGDRVLLWLEAIGGPAHGLELTTTPSS